jgi:diaminopimelate epimerase
MGNPHAVIRVESVATAPVASLGQRVQQSSRFPEGVNVGFMAVLSRTEIDLRVFERGVGETLACGTGACAAVVAGRIRGWLDPVVTVNLRGGSLTIAWQGEGHSVIKTGPATTVFEGTVTFD